MHIMVIKIPGLTEMGRIRMGAYFLNNLIIKVRVVTKKRCLLAYT